METKKFTVYLATTFLATILMLVPGYFTAQSPQQAQEKSYYMQEGDEKPTIFQTIKWVQGKYVKWYHVLIEMQNDDQTWKPYEDYFIKNRLPVPVQTTELEKDRDRTDGEETTRDKTAEPTEPTEQPLQTQQPLTYVQNVEYLGEGLYKTTETQLVLCLSAKEDGSAQKYRYTITLFNLLEQAAFTTQPMEFEVKKAFIPQLESISKEIIYLDTVYDGNITVRGENLKDITQFSLKTRFGSEILPLKVKTSDNETRADLVFDVELFDVGNWHLVAENPGEFAAEIPLEIKFMKWYDLNISVGYAPQIVVADGTIKKYFGKSFIPLGVDARLTFIPIKRRFGYFGFAIDARASRISASYEGYDLATQFFQGTLLAVYKLPLLNKKLFLEARAGGGVTIVQGLQFSFPHDLKSEPFNSAYAAVQAGSSFSYNIWKGLYAEAGVDVIMSFIPDMPVLQVVPQVAVGWSL